MSKPIDTPERRSALRGAAEISAAKHLARAYSYSMRRRRRVGPVIYDIGVRGPAPALPYGELRFSDEGVLLESRLFGTVKESPSILELAGSLEYGPYPETSPVPLATAAIAVVAVPELTSLFAPEPSDVPALEEAGVLALEEAGEPGLLYPVITGSIEVVVSAPVRPAFRESWWLLPLEERRAAVLATVPSAKTIWTWFSIGLLLSLQFIGAFMLMASGAFVPFNLGASAVVLSLIGIGILVATIRAQDRRLLQLRSVGVIRPI